MIVDAASPAKANMQWAKSDSLRAGRSAFVILPVYEYLHVREALVSVRLLNINQSPDPGINVG